MDWGRGARERVRRPHRVRRRRLRRRRPARALRGIRRGGMQCVDVECALGGGGHAIQPRRRQMSEPATVRARALVSMCLCVCELTVCGRCHTSVVAYRDRFLLLLLLYYFSSD